MAKPNPILPEISEQERKTLLSLVNTAGPNECWEWQGGRTKKNYPIIYIKPSRGQYLQVKVHRLVYREHYGIDPGNLFVCHECDNPPCCNPSHLFLGTDLDNIADRTAKKRTVAGDRHWTRKHPERVPRGPRHLWIKRCSKA